MCDTLDQAPADENSGETDTEAMALCGPRDSGPYHRQNRLS